jgi:hypothetical protein
MLLIILGDAVSELLLFVFKVKSNQPLIDMTELKQSLRCLKLTEMLLTDFNQILNEVTLRFGQLPLYLQPRSQNTQSLGIHPIDSLLASQVVHDFEAALNHSGGRLVSDEVISVDVFDLFALQDCAEQINTTFDLE